MGRGKQRKKDKPRKERGYNPYDKPIGGARLNELTGMPSALIVNPTEEEIEEIYREKPGAIGLTVENEEFAKLQASNELGAKAWNDEKERKYQEMFRPITSSGLPRAKNATVNIPDSVINTDQPLNLTTAPVSRYDELRDRVAEEQADKIIADDDASGNTLWKEVQETLRNFRPEERRDPVVWRELTRKRFPDWSEQKIDMAYRIAQHIIEKHENEAEPLKAQRAAAANMLELQRLAETGAAIPIGIDSAYEYVKPPDVKGGGSQWVDGYVPKPDDPNYTKTLAQYRNRTEPAWVPKSPALDGIDLGKTFSDYHAAKSSMRDPKHPEEGHYRTDLESMPHAMIEIAEKQAPDLFAKFYPRIYDSLGNYHSPKVLAAFFTTAVIEIIRLGHDRVPTSYRMLNPALEEMARRRMPHFFVAPKLLEAVQLTDFHDDIAWTKMPLPYEQGVFILPKGAFKHEKDGDVSAVIWARYRKGVTYPPAARRAPATTLAHDCFALVALCPEKGIWYDSIFNAEHRSTIKMRNMFYRSEGEQYPKLAHQHYMDEDLTEKDEDFLEKLGVVCFGTLLAMNARPDLVKKGTLLKRVGKKGEKEREFWSPNVVGDRYQPKREIPKIVDGKFVKQHKGAVGTHASPRYHWRRGHYRNQRHGHQLRETKVIWIEPVQVGLHLVQSEAS